MLHLTHSRTPLRATPRILLQLAFNAQSRDLMVRDAPGLVEVLTGVSHTGSSALSRATAGMLALLGTLSGRELGKGGQLGGRCGGEGGGRRG